MHAYSWVSDIWHMRHCCHWFQVDFMPYGWEIISNQVHHFLINLQANHNDKSAISFLVLHKLFHLEWYKAVAFNSVWTCWYANHTNFIVRKTLLSDLGKNNKQINVSIIYGDIQWCANHVLDNICTNRKTIVPLYWFSFKHSGFHSALDIILPNEQAKHCIYPEL